MITCSLLAKAARKGDEFALAEIDRAARTLGIGVANVITLFCPERYIIGGGVALMGDVLFDPLRKYVDEFVIGCFRGKYDIVPAELEQDVVLVGALLLAGEGPRHSRNP
jgi:glucokinase